MNVVWSDFVKTGIIKKFFFYILEVCDSIPNYRQTSKENTVRLVKPSLVNSLTRKYRKHSKPELWHHKEHTFVKAIYYNEGVATVGLSSVQKQ